METKLQELKTLLTEIFDLQSAASVLRWDQTTYMPPGGAPARARQLAYLGRLAQEKNINPVIGKLLDDLRPYEESLPYDSDDASLIRVARRDYEHLVKVPPDLVEELYRNAADSYQAWTQARPANDFRAMVPNLEKTLELSRRLADCFPGYEHIADPLIDEADYGMKAETIRALFAELRAALVPIARAVLSKPSNNDSCLRQHFPEDKQLQYGEQIIRRLGYDFFRGRVDKTHHPFMTKFSLGDIRITTRVKEDFLGEALFSNIHEAGHAMYEQGIRAELDGSVLAGGTSAGVHESQSRLWENIVGRSLPFWTFFYPQVQAAFPDQLSDVSLETFYRDINTVERSLIRTDADEVTYNLHVMLRFDLEIALLEGSLSIPDLPEAWNARYAADLGIEPPDDRNGVLQDVHWYAGFIGGNFQGYTLGNILSAQFYECALNTHPEIPAQIEQGEFRTLLGWLRENVYQHGRKFTPSELTERVTGGPISIAPYVSYLKTKYGELYNI